MQLSRLLEKDLKTIIFKLYQLSLQYLLIITRHWKRIDLNVKEFWTDQKIDLWLNYVHEGLFFIGPLEVIELRKWQKSNPNWYVKIKKIAKNTIRGKVAIFDRVYDLLSETEDEEFPWHKDWRFDYSWQPEFYKSYDFYEEEKVFSYDVKFPWELSRLSFLIPIAELAIITGDDKWFDFCCDVLEDWEDKNPIARSVNWNGMECSIRVINLAFITLLLSVNQDIRSSQLAPFLREISLHGDFIFKNLEYTDVRGNHYTANIIAMLIAGHLLKGVYKPAELWFSQGKKRIEQEILLQYCSDGVNFEKSTSYHRLVTELNLIGLIVLDKEGHYIKPIVKRRIYQACQYIRSYTRPDGLAPNIGDNDSARIFNFDPLPIRDHSALLALGSVYFSEPDLNVSKKNSSATIPLFLGNQGVISWQNIKGKNVHLNTLGIYKEGGIFISKSSQHFFFADFGGVGLKGRGGHGHNDVFSFELVLDKYPIIIDPGTYLYTGDLKLHKLFRSTASHNTVKIDNEEIAHIKDHWRISDEADPINVYHNFDGDIDTIGGEHHGYRRLDDPVVHKRKMKFDKKSGYLQCTDILECNQSHQVKRYLHFNYGLELVLSDYCNELVIYRKSKQFGKVSWTKTSKCYLESYQLSNNYGNSIESKKLVLENDIAGTNVLVFEIELLKENI